MKKLKQFFKGFKKGFKDFGMNIANIINSLLLLIVYIIGVGLTSIVAKLVGKHFLEDKKPSNKKSYWKELGLKKKPTEEYYRQF